jgi:hypothetical protein
MFLYLRCFGTNFRKFAYICVPRIGVPSCFLFHRMVQNGIPRVCFYFCSRVRNSEHFSLPRHGSERNSESFLFRGTAEIPLEHTILFRLFRLPWNYFFVGNSQPYFRGIGRTCGAGAQNSPSLSQSSPGWPRSCSPTLTSLLHRDNVCLRVRLI